MEAIRRHEACIEELQRQINASAAKYSTVWIGGTPAVWCSAFLPLWGRTVRLMPAPLPLHQLRPLLGPRMLRRSSADQHHSGSTSGFLQKSALAAVPGVELQHQGHV
jgi:hypothetical protein